MSHSSFTILAAIYHLLSNATEQELLSTSERQDVTPNIRRALIALAAEASQRAEPDSVRAREVVRKRLGDRKRSGNSDARAALRRALKLVSDRRHFPDKPALARFVKEIGLDFKVDPKWGMPRAVRAVARAIAEQPGILAKLDLEGEHHLDPRTKGWLDIILGTK